MAEASHQILYTGRICQLIKENLHLSQNFSFGETGPMGSTSKQKQAQLSHSNRATCYVS